MSQIYTLSSDFRPKLEENTSDQNKEKKSFAREIVDKNREIREQYRIIIQETVDGTRVNTPKDTKQPKKK